MAVGAGRQRRDRGADIWKNLVGVVAASLINVLLFSIAAELMFLISRRHSNVARWLLVIPFNLLILFYDIGHLGLMEDTCGSIALYLVPFRLGFMACATWALFTPCARAWFAGRPDPLIQSVTDRAGIAESRNHATRQGV